jgi:hypothetical protein
MFRQKLLRKRKKISRLIVIDLKKMLLKNEERIDLKIDIKKSSR